MPAMRSALAVRWCLALVSCELYSACVWHCSLPCCCAMRHIRASGLQPPTTTARNHTTHNTTPNSTSSDMTKILSNHHVAKFC
eukprot:scaffold4079_cov44-Cyclotella_meneghiniana.AAC.6